MAEQPIRVSVPDIRQRRRIRREIFLAVAGLCVVVLLTIFQLKYLGINSYLYVGLFNLNFIFLLLTLFVVGRNAVKLLLERRRKVLGSKLRTRLVLGFVSLSLIPTALLFVASVLFLHASVNYWFRAPVSESMQQALELGRSFYALTQERQERRGQAIRKAVTDRGAVWGTRAAGQILSAKAEEFELSLLGLVAPDGEARWGFAGDPSLARAWPELRAKADWADLSARPRSWSTLASAQDADLVLSLVPVDGGHTGFLVLGETMGRGLLFKLDQVVRGADEYKKLTTLKYPLRVSLVLSLGVMAMLIILGAIWFGFRLAKELSGPIQALAAGTQRIARGDLSVRLEDRSDDELGLLVQSFNRMAEDLEDSQASLRTANERLGQQNMELERRGRYMEAVLNNITAGVVSLDAEGRVSTVNHAAESMLGLNARLVLGKSPAELVRGGDLAELIVEARQQIRKKPESTWQRQLTLSVNNRHRKFLVNVVSMRLAASGETGVVAVFEDITDLEKMQRTAAWREVAQRIAHEIKNPLTPIKLSAERLQRKYGDKVGDPVFTECTGLIVKQVQHLQEMVSEFSSYAKLPEAEPRPDHLPPLLEEVAALFRHSHRDIDWSLEMPPDMPETLFDREGLRRVLINLLTNAAEAITGDESPGRPAGQVALAAFHDPARGLVGFEVRDNGPGFSPEERSRMFEPYFSRKKGGTGLGLAIVQSVVNDHRGSVRVRPNAPRGTVFVVELPVK